MAEVDLSNDWRASGTHHIVTAEGRTITLEERDQGVRFTNELGQTWFLPHVSGDDGDASVITVAGKKFRAVPG